MWETEDRVLYSRCSNTQTNSQLCFCCLALAPFVLHPSVLSTPHPPPLSTTLYSLPSSLRACCVHIRLAAFSLSLPSARLSIIISVSAGNLRLSSFFRSPPPLYFFFLLLFMTSSNPLSLSDDSVPAAEKWTKLLGCPSFLTVPRAPPRGVVPATETHRCDKRPSPSSGTECAHCS